MIRLAVLCAPEQADRVLAELVELVPGGVEEDRAGDWVEFAIYGPPGELPELGEIEAAAGAGLVEIETTEIPDDWADRWRDFHEPVWIGDRLLVRPSWEEDVAPAPVEVVIDPGRAFGTGAHATTALCLELLLGLADSSPDPGSAADLGTGSGVLAIAAAKLGFGPVRAFDHERAAVEAAAANAELNRVDVDVQRLNLRERAPPAADLWICNLTAPLLLTLAERAAAGGRPGAMVLSGLLAGERERVEAAFTAAGYRVQARPIRGDWAALLLIR